MIDNSVARPMLDQLIGDLFEVVFIIDEETRAGADQATLDDLRTQIDGAVDDLIGAYGADVVKNAIDAYRASEKLKARYVKFLLERR